MRIQHANWYDYPQYCDLAFRSETAGEVAFLEAACRKYCGFPVRRILEPGCGGGRLIVALAARGYQVTGFDLSRQAVEYVRRRLERRKLRARVFQGDMARFKIARPVDAVINTWNTFRHLTTEETARHHLKCAAASLRRGGIYVLGFHLLPPDVSDECVERWSARHGRTQLTVTLRVLGTDHRRRIEHIRVNLCVRSTRQVLRLCSDFPLRRYTAPQFLRLLRTVPEFELLDVYDFWYDIAEPLILDDQITDTVFILRRR